MHILYDHQIFEMQSYGGISRYFYELINNSRRQNDVVAELIIKRTNNIYLNKDTFFKEQIQKINSYYDFIPHVRFKGKMRLYEILKKIGKIPDYKKINMDATIDKLKTGNFNIFHPTYYNDYFLDYLEKKPFVLTIYDMIYEIYPEFFYKYYDDIKMKQKLALKAQKIVTISNNTKKDIINFFEIDGNRIEVIYLASSIKDQFDVRENNFAAPIPGNYILFVGSRNGYKNFYFFIRAISNILKSDKDLNVVCAGGGAFSNEEKCFFEALEINKQLKNFDICDDKFLSFLYSNALFFIFPSLYEGFGLPILEAFSCGCPVISSNTGALMEIAGDAVIYFSPKDINSIYDTVREVINDSSLRKGLIKKGMNRIKEFTWEKTVEQTKRVYESII